MKKITVICWMFISICATAQTKYNNVLYKDNFAGFPTLMYLPKDYQQRTYPLLVFLHGRGEAGNDLSKMLIYSPLGFINSTSWRPDMIVIAPQASSWSVSTHSLDEILKAVANKYNIDWNRLYLTGLSAGGQTVWNYSALYQISPKYKPAAIVPMSAASMVSQGDINNVASYNVHEWGFGSNSDLWGQQTQKGADGLNKLKPGFGRFTEYNGGHCCWANYYNPAYKENGLNIYQWMLQYSLNGKVATPPVIVKPPIISPKDTVYLHDTIYLKPVKTILQYSDGTSKTMK